MLGQDGINVLNANNALRQRALAYAQNHPGVDVTQATMILARRDAEATVKRNKRKRVEKSHARAKSKDKCCP